MPYFAQSLTCFVLLLSSHRLASRHLVLPVETNLFEPIMDPRNNGGEYSSTQNNWKAKNVVCICEFVF